MEKPDFLPFSIGSEITIDQALEACEYLAEEESSLQRYLSADEIHFYLLGESGGTDKNRVNDTISKVGRLASAAMGSVRYKNSKELAQKINSRRNELNLL